MEARRGGHGPRTLGVSRRTIYAWKTKYGGMSVSEAQRLRQLAEKKLSMVLGPISRSGWIETNV